MSIFGMFNYDDYVNLECGCKEKPSGEYLIKCEIHTKETFQQEEDSYIVKCKTEGCNETFNSLYKGSDYCHQDCLMVHAINNLAAAINKLTEKK